MNENQFVISSNIHTIGERINNENAVYCSKSVNLRVAKEFLRLLRCSSLYFTSGSVLSTIPCVHSLKVIIARRDKLKTQWEAFFSISRVCWDFRAPSSNSWRGTWQSVPCLLKKSIETKNHLFHMLSHLGVGLLLLSLPIVASYHFDWLAWPASSFMATFMNVKRITLKSAQWIARVRTGPPALDGAFLLDPLWRITCDHKRRT